MKRFISLFVSLCSLAYTQILDEATLLEHLNSKNPNIYAIIGKNSIESEKIGYALGAFDSNINAKYEQKEYPNSQADYKDFYLSKTFENAIEVHLGYRDAYGTQEYNNIKTGDDGEVIASLKMPLVELIKGVNSKKYNLQKAKNSFTSVELQSSKEIRNFKLSVLKKYYELLYLKELVRVHEELLQKSLLRENFVKQKVKEGSLGSIEALEAKGQRLEYSQNLKNVQKNYEVLVEELSFYMNLSSLAFYERFELPKLKEKSKQEYDLESSIATAIENRSELKAIQNSREMFALDQKYFSLLAYPKTNLSAYGLYDPIYKEGYKVALTFDFALERTAYEAKQKETIESLKHANALLERSKKSIESKIRILIVESKRVAQNIAIAKERLLVLQELEQAQQHRYEIGVGTLFAINQRELLTLAQHKKLLQLKLEAIVIDKAIQREMEL